MCSRMNSYGAGGDEVKGLMAFSGAKRCAACRTMRRRCRDDCAFSPYFPASQPSKFICIHRVFGAANVCKMLKHLPMEQRGVAVDCLEYEANERIRDPVYGCTRVVAELQHQLLAAQQELAIVRAEIAWCRSQELHLLEKQVQQGATLDGAELSSATTADPYHLDRFAFADTDLDLDI